MYYQVILALIPKGVFPVERKKTCKQRSPEGSLCWASTHLCLLSSYVLSKMPFTNKFLSLPQSTPIQGSKLRLPGYLSGKGFQSGEEGTLINAAVLKARGQGLGKYTLWPTFHIQQITFIHWHYTSKITFCAYCNLSFFVVFSNIVNYFDNVITSL